jgi:hypothetical protein
MNRKLALGVLCVGGLALGACNRNYEADRQANSDFAPGEPVWYDSNGVRVHHSQLTGTVSDDWYGAVANDEDYVKKSTLEEQQEQQPPDQQQRPQQQMKPGACPGMR